MKERSRPGPSEFDPKDPGASGERELVDAASKARWERRTGQPSDVPPLDLDADPDDFVNGGVTSDNWDHIR